MKTFSSLVRMTSVSLLLMGASGSAQAMDFDGAEVSPNRVLAKFIPGAGASDLAGSTELRNFEAVGVSVLEVSAPTEAALKSVILEIEDSGLVEYAEPDYVVSADLTPSDPRFGEQWGLHNTGELGGTIDADIDAPEAWDVRTASSGVIVVIDSGIDYNHVDLAANVWVNPGEIPANGLDDDGNGYVDDVHGINAITGSGDPLDDRFHGTHVSGTIGAVGDNASGVTGVNWSTQIMACKFLDSSGRGFTSDAVECLNYVATMKTDHGVDIRVTNNSWGGSGFSQSLSDAIELTGDLGILFVASAGNTGSSNDEAPRYPASFPLPSIIAVANTNRFDQLSASSSFGATSVDLGAPGSQILSTFPGNAYETISGTSMAAPHVAGAAMLTWTQHPTFNHLEVKETLESTVDPLASLSGLVATGGRLNLFNALTCDLSDFQLTTSLADGFEVITTNAVVLTAQLASCRFARGAVVDASFDNGNPDVALLDNGVGPDQVANDGTYSGTWIPAGLGPVIVTVDALFESQLYTTSVDGNVLAIPLLFDAFDRGWYNDTGFHADSNNNTFTGLNGSGTTLYNSFFTFDLMGLTSVSSGTLRLELESYVGPDPSEDFTVFDVVTDVPTLNATNSGRVDIFEDLESGAMYGAGTAASADVGSVLEIPLSDAAIADINAAAGGLFAVGVHVDQITLPFGNEGLRWSNGSESRTHQLVLETGCLVIDAIDDQFSVINDGATADFFVLANDECSGDTPISVVELLGDLLPDRGGAAATDGAKVSYTPAAGFVGLEQFTYSAEDAGLEGGEDPPTVDQDTAVVRVDVLEDIAPDAVDDGATTFRNQATIIDVLENDALGNAPNVVGIETVPANGSATLPADDTIQYVPNFNFFGEDSFEYRLTDVNGDSDVATVTVGVFFDRGPVPIDIMPADPGNNVNLRAGSGASIPVAILSVSGFEAPLIDPSTLKFGPRQAEVSGNPRVRDVDGDGEEDLLVKFLTEETGIACGDTHASLSGETFDFQLFSGTDAINTFACPRTRKRY